MIDNEKNGSPAHHEESLSDILCGINAIRSGTIDVRKGLAKLFLRKSSEGVRLISNGIAYMDEGVSHIQQKLEGESIIQTSESYEHILLGIETEQKAVALLKEGIKDFYEKRFADGIQSIVHGLFLAESGLKEIDEGGRASGEKHLPVLREMFNDAVNIQKKAKEIACGLDDIQNDSIEDGVKTVAESALETAKALDHIQELLQSLRDAEPEYLQSIIEGIQIIEDGQKAIQSGIAAINDPPSDEACPVCLGIERIGSGLRSLQEGTRGIKRGIRFLQTNGDSRK